MALVAHFSLGQQRLIGGDPGPLKMAEHKMRYIGVGDHTPDSWNHLSLGGVQIYDASVVVWRSECLGHEHVWHLYVIDKTQLPGDVSRRIGTRDPCTNSLHNTPPGITVVFRPSAVIERSNSVPSAAAATASMILT